MKKKILIVDDSASWRKFHLAALKTIKPNSFEYDLAESAREALEIILNTKNAPFDLIISDLQMETDYEPDLAGEWLIKNIKNINEYKNKKIIIISAMYNIETIAKTLEVDYLRKSTLANNILPLKLKLEELI